MYNKNNCVPVALGFLKSGFLSKPHIAGYFRPPWPASVPGSQYAPVCVRMRVCEECTNSMGSWGKLVTRWRTSRKVIPPTDLSHVRHVTAKEVLNTHTIIAVKCRILIWYATLFWGSWFSMGARGRGKGRRFTSRSEGSLYAEYTKCPFHLWNPSPNHLGFGEGTGDGVRAQLSGINIQFLNKLQSHN